MKEKRGIAKMRNCQKDGLENETYRVYLDCLAGKAGIAVRDGRHTKVPPIAASGVRFGAK